METFSISSSVSLDNSSSTLRCEKATGFLLKYKNVWRLHYLVKYVVSRIILDEAALFLSDKSNAVSVNLARGKLTSETVLNATLHEALTNFDFFFLSQIMSKW